jgi:hypothetical protein
MESQHARNLSLMFMVRIKSKGGKRLSIDDISVEISTLMSAPLTLHTTFFFQFVLFGELPRMSFSLPRIWLAPFSY